MDYTHRGWRYRSEDAEAYLASQLAADLAAGGDIELIREYIATSRIQRDIGDLRAVGIANSLYQIRTFLPGPYAGCTKADVYAGIAALKNHGYKPNTLNLHLINLRAFLLWLIDEERSALPYQEIAQIKIPKRTAASFTADDVLTEDEVRLVLDHCRTPRDRAFAAVLYDGGFRCVDLAEMRWKDLTFHEGSVAARTSAKTGIERIAHLTQSISALRTWREHYPGSPTGDNALFVSQRGRPLTYGAAQGIRQRLVKRIRAETGIDLSKRLSLHQFRRACITHEAARGRPIHHICMEKWGKPHSEQIRRYCLPGEEEILESKLEASGIVREKRKYQKRSPVAPVQCASCGLTWDAGTKFCTCGAPLTGEAARSLDDFKRFIAEDELIRREYTRRLILDMRERGEI
ncbi:MAG: tyrosine-type recombinase/integrase [Minisyncoccales bacterium]